MLHPILPMLFIFLYYSFSVALRPPAQHLSLGFDDASRPNTFPNGFDGCAADAKEGATCGSTQSKPSNAPKLKMRNRLFLGQITREEKGSEAATDAKSSAEKQRRQIPSDDNADGLANGAASNAQPDIPENGPEQGNEKRYECVVTSYKGCQGKQCIEDGGRCKIVHRNGKESCTQARLLENEAIGQCRWKDFTQLTRCKGCSCKREYDKMKIIDEDCEMTGWPRQNCPRVQAQQCYQAGGRCIVKEYRDGKRFCARHDELRGGRWAMQECKGCMCSVHGTRGRGWNNVELSKGALSTGFAALLYAAEAPRPKRRKPSPV